jgi:hypothetical protein
MNREVTRLFLTLLKTLKKSIFLDFGLFLLHLALNTLPLEVEGIGKVTIKHIATAM